MLRFMGIVDEIECSSKPGGLLGLHHVGLRHVVIGVAGEHPQRP